MSDALFRMIVGPVIPVPKDEDVPLPYRKVVHIPVPPIPVPPVPVP